MPQRQITFLIPFGFVFRCTGGNCGTSACRYIRLLAHFVSDAAPRQAIFWFNVGYYSLVAVEILEHLSPINLGGGKTHLFRVWPPRSGCIERTFRMLANIHGFLFAGLADFDFLAAIHCPADHSQLMESNWWPT
jgi:hypothetical protein